MPTQLFAATYRTARRVAVFVVGSTVLAIGVIMIVAPGPAIVFIPAGLAILGLEFAWARRWLKIVKERTGAAIDGLRRSDAKPESDAKR